MKRSSPEKVADNVEEMKGWQEELDRLQKLMPIRASQDRLKNTDLPALEKQIKEQEATIPPLSEKAEEVFENSPFCSLLCVGIKYYAIRPQTSWTS